jgi:hypothetical protein
MHVMSISFGVNKHSIQAVFLGQIELLSEHITSSKLDLGLHPREEIKAGTCLDD